MKPVNGTACASPASGRPAARKTGGGVMQVAVAKRHESSGIDTPIMPIDRSLRAWTRETLDQHRDAQFYELSSRALAEIDAAVADIHAFRTASSAGWMTFSSSVGSTSIPRLSSRHSATFRESASSSAFTRPGGRDPLRKLASKLNTTAKGHRKGADSRPLPRQRRTRSVCLRA